MKALLIVAHGSRREQSNEEVRTVAERLGESCSGQYNIIHAAFLELANPLIPDGIKKCIDEGARSIVVLPYFLNSGRHVIDDIPGIVKDTAKIHPGIEIKIAPHLGASDLMMDLLISMANSVQ